MIRRAAIALAALFAVASPGARAETPVPGPSLEPLAKGVWMHKSWATLSFGPYFSHGLVVADGDDVLLVDTAWNDPDTTALLALIEAEVGLRPTAAVVTHAHDDKMGGVGALVAAGVPTFALDLTNEDAPARGLTPAQNALASDEREWRLPGAPGGVVVFYPGPGHTRDNLVVGYPPAGVLFGGCMIRPLGPKTAGNVADADLSHWADAVRAAANRFPEALVVVPSHGAPGGRALLDHTISIVEAAAAE